MAIKKWTILAYLSGDNNLSERGVDDINEMAKVGSNNELNIVAQFDRDGNLGTRRFYVTKDGGYDKDVIQELGQTNMGDPKVLEDFLIWGIKKYPAEHYMLVLWGHGNGCLGENISSQTLEFNQERKSLLSFEAIKLESSGRRLKGSLFSTSMEEIVKIPDKEIMLRAFGHDDGSGDFLDLIELKNVLSSVIKKSKIKKFDIIGFDACLMNMLEVCYQIKNSAKIFVGSEEEIPGKGWPFDRILGAMIKEPDMIPIELSKMIVDEYIRSYEMGNDNPQVTLSSINLEKIVGVKDKVDKLADILIKEIKNKDVFKDILQSSSLALSFYGFLFLDVYHFAQLLEEKSSSDAIKTRCQEIIKVLDSSDGYVIASGTLNKRMENAHGVSIYFPGRFLYSPFYDKTDMSKKGKWDSFIKAYQEEYDKVP